MYKVYKLKEGDISPRVFMGGIGFPFEDSEPPRLAEFLIMCESEDENIRRTTLILCEEGVLERMREHESTGYFSDNYKLQEEFNEEEEARNYVKERCKEDV